MPSAASASRKRGPPATTAAPQRKKPKALVPDFPVVKAAPSSSSTRQPRKSTASEANEDDLPPVVSSARRPASQEKSDRPSRGFVPPASPHPKRGGDRNFNRSPKHAASDRHSRKPAAEASPSPSSTPAVPPPRGPQPYSRHVITRETPEGTELPEKLNNKVFIDGLPYHHEPAGKSSLEEELLNFITTWKVGKALRLIKKPGQGFGFVVFKSPHSVDTAVRVLHGRKFLGRALRVEVPKVRDLEKIGEVGALKDIGKSSYQRQVLVSDLSKITQPEMLRELLRDLAPQMEKKLEMIKMTAKNRKAFLTFESEEDAVSAVEFLNGLVLLGRKVTASKAAAPGTLPYSKHAVGTHTAAAAAAVAPAAAGEEGNHFEEEDADDQLVVPLGMSVASAAAPSNPRSSRPASAAAPSSKSSSTAGGASSKKYSNLLDDGPSEVYVGNLSEDITESQLREHFSECGAIKSCSLLVNPSTHLPSGIAKVEFALPAYAAYAKEHLHGSRLRGAVVRVDRGSDPSPALATEQGGIGEAEEDDAYNEEETLRRYGIKDKKAYFKGTSLAQEDDSEEEHFYDVDADGEEEDRTGEPQKKRNALKNASKSKKMKNAVKASTKPMKKKMSKKAK